MSNWYLYDPKGGTVTNNELFNVIMVVAIVIVVLVGTFGGLSYVNCHVLTDLHTERELHWGFLAGCRIKTVNNLWVRVDEINSFEGQLVIEERE
jgi:hypothetical protein